MKTLRILGTRGIPAAHGGFETFAEHLALHLQQQGWRVIVYCQHEAPYRLWSDTWEGIERINISVTGNGALSTIKFDWLATQHASRTKELCLTLGYNTAVFNALLRLRGVSNIFNMDGIEWARGKWGPIAKTWFWLNDWAGCLLGNHLVADNPGIEQHLLTRVGPDKITMIPYGALPIETADTQLIHALGLSANQYMSVIARPEPENSILEIVQAFSQKPRGIHLAVLGNFSQDNPYHQLVRQAASDEVKFLGAIYEPETVRALRHHSMAYLHGHQVGGTNPSLVEALGAGNAVIAHDNRYNRWVAGPEARYFHDTRSLSESIDAIINSASTRCAMQSASLARFQEELTWPIVLKKYEKLLAQWAN